MAALEPSTTASATGHTYTQIRVGDSARAHLGDSYYTFQVRHAQLNDSSISLICARAPYSSGTTTNEALTGSAQYIISNPRSQLNHLEHCSVNFASGSKPCFRDGGLLPAVNRFRASLQKPLPAAILASLPQNRASLLPARDLVAVISEVCCPVFQVSGVAWGDGCCARRPKRCMVKR